MLKPSLLVLSLILAPLPALADRDHHRDRGHRGWDRHDRHHHRDWHRPRTSISVSFGTPSYRFYPYYRPTRVVYAPSPPVTQREVVYINDSNSRRVASDDGRYCREYQAVSKIGGVSQQTYGTACRQPDGSWEIIS